MKNSVKSWFSFGVTSGVITTLGLMVGLAEGTSSRYVVIGGIIMIAVADALSDALGVHISTESDKKNSDKKIWISTISTFASKSLVAITFLAPVILLELQTAIFVSALWGALLLGIFSYIVAKQGNKKPFNVISGHLIIAALVILATYFLGNLIERSFG